MFQRFWLWVVAGALSVWISIAMVAAPGVAFAAPESGSNSVGTESSEPATPTKPTQQHKPAKTRAEKKPDARSAPSGTAGDHNDEAKDPPADHVTGADQKPEVKGPAKTPATSGADVDQDVHEATEEGPKGVVAQDIPVIFEPEPDPSGSEDAAVPEPAAQTGEDQSTGADKNAGSQANGSATSSSPGAEAGTGEDNVEAQTTDRGRRETGARCTCGEFGRARDRRGHHSRNHDLGALPRRHPDRKDLGLNGCHLRAAAPAAETAQRRRHCSTSSARSSSAPWSS